MKGTKAKELEAEEVGTEVTGDDEKAVELLKVVEVVGPGENGGHKLVQLLHRRHRLKS